eukprot:5125923-Prymnesium_polylepis.1
MCPYGHVCRVQLKLFDFGKAHAPPPVKVATAARQAASKSPPKKSIEKQAMQNLSGRGQPSKKNGDGSADGNARPARGR